MVYKNTKGHFLINNKLLHRIIWENYHKCKIPEGYVIHHIDEDKSNNCVYNLCCLPKEFHDKLHHLGSKNHMYGKCGDKHHHYKPIFTKAKAGFKPNGKQNYAIKFQSKIIKRSVNESLIDYNLQAIYTNLKYNYIIKNKK